MSRAHAHTIGFIRELPKAETVDFRYYTSVRIAARILGVTEGQVYRLIYRAEHPLKAVDTPLGLAVNLTSLGMLRHQRERDGTAARHRARYAKPQRPPEEAVDDETVTNEPN